MATKGMQDKNAMKHIDTGTAVERLAEIRQGYSWVDVEAEVYTCMLSIVVG